MSITAQAKAARRKSRMDGRYVKAKSKDAAAIARKQAIMVMKQNQMKQRKSK